MTLVNTLFTPFSFLSFFLVLLLIPQLCTVKQWNFPLVSLLFWISGASLVYFVNANVWADNMVDFSPTWCNFSAHVVAGASTAVESCTLVIVRRLYYPSRIYKPEGLTHRRCKIAWEYLMDGAICHVLPVARIAANTFMQPRKYDVLEAYGCHLPMANLDIRFGIDLVPPLLLAVFTGIFAFVSIKKRCDRDKIPNQPAVLGLNRYVRMLYLALINMLLYIALDAYKMFIVSTGVIESYTTIAAVHGAFAVGTFTTAQWHAWRDAIAIELERWFIVAVAFACFVILAGEVDIWLYYKMLFTKAVFVLAALRQKIFLGWTRLENWSRCYLSMFKPDSVAANNNDECPYRLCVDVGEPFVVIFDPQGRRSVLPLPRGSILSLPQGSTLVTRQSALSLARGSRIFMNGEKRTSTATAAAPTAAAASKKRSTESWKRLSVSAVPSSESWKLLPASRNRVMDVEQAQSAPGILSLALADDQSTHPSEDTIQLASLIPLEPVHAYTSTAARHMTGASPQTYEHDLSYY
ncbi:hypothetical protein FISHEDRAFT_62431 [Fistulina hepatica ATCC 64428]|nr:hypothetical protein FISHEDRAFT_62431 [Fistulina hepatica ATCC 64428]